MKTVETCFYCDSPLPKRRELDHFPIPARHGGFDVVPACVSCHDLKDRIPFSTWPAEMTRRVVEDMPNWNRESRILFARMIAQTMDIFVEKYGEDELLDLLIKMDSEK